MRCVAGLNGPHRTEVAVAGTSRQRRQFGSVRQLPSGKWQARYKGPDGRVHTADMTFRTKTDATTYLATVQADLTRGQWKAPVRSDATVAIYGEAWIREHPDLKDSTRAAYRAEFDLHIRPHLGHYRLDLLQPQTIREWRARVGDGIREAWAGTGTSGGSRPRNGKATQARVYRLLRAILTTAVSDKIIETNPCNLRRGGEYDTPERPYLSVEDIEHLAAVVDPQYRTFVYFAAYSGLRLGEATSLRHKHVHLDEGYVHVMQAEGRFASGEAPATPKSQAGNRMVVLPGFLVDMLREHMRQQATLDPEAYVFTTRTGRSVYYGAPRAMRKAFDAIGRPDMATHDLRHSASVLKAMNGATVADLKSDLGHSTFDAAQKYMHASVVNQRSVADRLDQRRSATLGGSTGSDVVALTERSG